MGHLARAIYLLHVHLYSCFCWAAKSCIFVLLSILGGCFACADCLLILYYWVVRTCIIELFLVLVLVSWPFAGHYFAPCSVILLTFEFLMLLCVTLTQKNLKLRNFLALALVCTPFMLVVNDFFNKINPVSALFEWFFVVGRFMGCSLDDFSVVLLGTLHTVSWSIPLRIFFCFNNPWQFFHKSWSPLAVL